MAIMSSVTTYALDSKLFSFADNTFTAEASDLTGMEWLRQIYDDACDVGFGIRSQRTGQVIAYYLSEETKDAEGELMQWVFKPIPEHARKGADIANTRVIIFND